MAQRRALGMSATGQERQGANQLGRVIVFKSARIGLVHGKRGDQLTATLSWGA